MFGLLGKKTPMTWADIRNGRLLGPIERWHAGRAVLGHYDGTAVTCRYSIPQELASDSKHPRLAERLERAVARVILDHPMLQARVVNPSSASPSWARLQKMDLSKHVSWTLVDDAEDFKAARRRVLLEQLNGGFADRENRPSWNLAIVKPRNGIFLEAILDWCHIPFDGMGAKIFHQDLLKSLNADAEGSDIKLDGHTLDTSLSEKGLPPPPDVVTPWPLSIPYIVSGVWHEIGPDFFAKEAAPGSWPPPIDMLNRKTKMDSFEVSPDVLKRVIAACRAHSTTVTGLLQALIVVSLFSRLPVEKHPDVNHSMTAADLRRHMPTEIPGFPGLDAHRTVFNLASTTLHTFRAPLLAKIRQLAETSGPDDEKKRVLEDVMWNMAEQIRAEIKVGVDKGLKNERIGLVKLVSDWTTEHKKLETKPRHEAILGSNLGAFDGKQADEKWSIERAEFTLAADITGYALTAAAVSVKGGDMCVDVTWQDGTVEDELAQQVTRDMASWFEYVASTVNA